LWHYSPTSRELFRFFCKKYGQVVTPKVTAKIGAEIDCKLGQPRYSVHDIAPPRSFKTATCNELKNLLDPEFFIDLKSDFTMSSLKHYERELTKYNCLLINDGTILFASKAQRTKDRLVGGLSELLSDEAYCYQDYGTKFFLEGKVTVALNKTSEPFRNYKDRRALPRLLEISVDFRSVKLSLGDTNVFISV
jgi:hypothetical protein